MNEIIVQELLDKCKQCSARRHRVGIVKACEYECPVKENAE